MQNLSMCGEKLILHIHMNTPTPQWNMNVAATCSADVFLGRDREAVRAVGTMHWVKYNANLRYDASSNLLAVQVWFVRTYL